MCTIARVPPESQNTVSFFENFDAEHVRAAIAEHLIDMNRKGWRLLTTAAIPAATARHGIDMYNSYSLTSNSMLALFWEAAVDRFDGMPVPEPIVINAPIPVTPAPDVSPPAALPVRPAGKPGHAPEIPSDEPVQLTLHVSRQISPRTGVLALIVSSPEASRVTRPLVIETVSASHAGNFGERVYTSGRRNTREKSVTAEQLERGVDYQTERRVQDQRAALRVLEDLRAGAYRILGSFELSSI